MLPQNSSQEVQSLRTQASRDPKVLKALRVEFEFRNKARRVLAEENGEKNETVLEQLESTISLEEMIEKAEQLAA